MTDGIPVTRRLVSAQRADNIRQMVRRAETLGDAPDASRLARPDDAPALYALLSDPAVHAPIYTLPRPLTEASVQAFIQSHLDEREAGTGLLFVRAAEDGRIMGYSDVQVWPHWAAGSWAARCTRQSTIEGRAHAARRQASTGCSNRSIWTCCVKRPALRMCPPSACWTGWALSAKARWKAVGRMARRDGPSSGK